MKNKNLYFFGFCFFCLGEKDSAEAQEVEGGGSREGNSVNPSESDRISV